MVELKKNLWPAKIFILVQSLCFIVFLFEHPIISFLNASSNVPTIEYSNSCFGTICSFSLIVITFLFLLKVKTLRPSNYKIKIPSRLLVLSLLCESLLTFKLYYFAESSALLREAIDSGEVSVGLARINTFFLYFLAMLFFGKIGNINHHLKKSDVLIACYFFTLFFFKGLIFSSRGSFANIIAFSFAGYTFFRSNISFTIKQIIMTAFILIVGSFLLTSMRSGRILMDDDLFSAVVSKLSGNFNVTCKYLNNELLVTDVYNLGQNIWFEESNNPDSSLNLKYLSIKQSINQYTNVLLSKPFDPSEGYYFKIYENLPFNSSNFLFKFLVFKGLFPFVFCLIFTFYMIFSKLSPASCFFVYCLMMIFSVLSFTANPFFDIPFCLIPFFGLLFNKCFVRIRYCSKNF